MGVRTFQPISVFKFLEEATATSGWISPGAGHRLNIVALNISKATSDYAAIWASASESVLLGATATVGSWRYFGEEGIPLAASAPLGYTVVGTVTLGVVGFIS